jgi:hypothetical protein
MLCTATFGRRSTPGLRGHIADGEQIRMRQDQCGGVGNPSSR